MSLLEKAREFAAGRGVVDPLSAAKKATETERARELYAAFQELSGETVRLGDERGRIDVTLGLGAAHVNVKALAKLVVRTPKGKEIRWKATGRLIGGWSAWHDGEKFVMKQSGGPEKPFAEIDDLIAHLAKSVGAVLEA